MTTAHRPTWKAATGGSEQGGSKMVIPTRSYSSRDLPGYLHLKQRQPGQGTQGDLKEVDFKEELLRKEQEAKQKNS